MAARASVCPSAPLPPRFVGRQTHGLSVARALLAARHHGVTERHSEVGWLGDKAARACSGGATKYDRRRRQIDGLIIDCGQAKGQQQQRVAHLTKPLAVFAQAGRTHPAKMVRGMAMQCCAACQQPYVIVKLGLRAGTRDVPPTFSSARLASLLPVASRLVGAPRPLSAPCAGPRGTLQEDQGGGPLFQSLWRQRSAGGARAAHWPRARGGRRRAHAAPAAGPAARQGGHGAPAGARARAGTCACSRARACCCACTSASASARRGLGGRRRGGAPGRGRKVLFGAGRAARAHLRAHA